MSNHAMKPKLELQSVGVVPAVAGIDAVALYDPKDGRVVHMHHTITFEGAERRRDREGCRRTAVESARRLGREVDGLEMLFVPDFEPSNQAYKVDLDSSRLIAIPLPRPKPGRR